MKIFFIISILFAPLSTDAQNYLKFHVTPSGDTITKDCSVKILPVRGHQYIYPSGKMQPSMKSSYMSYLNSGMTGRSYPINYIKKYGNKQVAASVIVNDKDAPTANNIEYIIILNEALKYSEVEIIKPH